MNEYDKIKGTLNQLFTKYKFEVVIKLGKLLWVKVNLFMYFIFV